MNKKNIKQRKNNERGKKENKGRGVGRVGVMEDVSIRKLQWSGTRLVKSNKAKEKIHTK